MKLRFRRKPTPARPARPARTGPGRTRRTWDAVRGHLVTATALILFSLAAWRVDAIAGLIVCGVSLLVLEWKIER